MFCTSCGAKNNDDAKFCSECGSKINNADDNNNNYNDEQNCNDYNSYNSQTNYNTVNENMHADTRYNYQQTVRYAGFWIRFVASLIDGLIVGAVYWIINMLVLVPIISEKIEIMSNDQQLINQLNNIPQTGTEQDAFNILGIVMNNGGGYILAVFLVIVLIESVMRWLYYSIMESSPIQATVGKLALGIKVTDMDGNKISFLRATGRYFGKIVSRIILGIGYFMAGFTEKKQALHDMMAGCLVIKK